jgi:hypothetical protein
LVETSLFKLAKEKKANCIITVARTSVHWNVGDEIIAHIAPLPMHMAQQLAIATNKDKPKSSHAFLERYQ